MHERTWHITAGLLVAVVGFVIAASTLNTAGRYVACFIFPMGAYSVNSVIIGWASSTLSQTKEKKAVSQPGCECPFLLMQLLIARQVVLAMTNVGGQVCWFPPNFYPMNSLLLTDRLHIRRVPLAR